MKKTFWFSVIGSVALSSSAQAQGTFVFDQQSSTVETAPSGIFEQFQIRQPFGQSFMPTLSSIDFVRLYVGDYIFPNGPGAQIYVNLLSDSITGSVMATSSTIFMPGSFSGYTNFVFPGSVALTPGTTYYLEPVALSGNPNTQILASFTYLNGTLYSSGTAQNAQLWFREGIVVPEPSTVALVAIGLMALPTCKHRRQH